QRISLPLNATSLVLPNAPNIRIFSMSLATNTTPETVVAGGAITQNLPPWANAGPDQKVNAQGTNATVAVTLNGSASADPDGSIKWLDFANSYPSTRQSWIQYQYGGGRQYVDTNYTITSANDAPDRDPYNWALLGSNDGGTNWVTLDTRTGQVFGSRFLTQTY